MDWGVFEYHGSVHVIPLDDEREHYSDAECNCQPVYSDGCYIHNSYDGREAYELGEKQVS